MASELRRWCRNRPICRRCARGRRRGIRCGRLERSAKTRSPACHRATHAYSRRALTPTPRATAAAASPWITRRTARTRPAGVIFAFLCTFTEASDELLVDCTHPQLRSSCLSEQPPCQSHLGARRPRRLGAAAHDSARGLDLRDAGDALPGLPVVAGLRVEGQNRRAERRPSTTHRPAASRTEARRAATMGSYSAGLSHVDKGLNRRIVGGTLASPLSIGNGRSAFNAQKGRGP